MVSIPESYLDLLQQKKAFASLATVMPDGTPQVTPVWFDYAGGKLRVNTAKGRVKARNLKPGAAVALAIMDPDNPYRYSRSAGGSPPPPKTALMRISTSLPRSTLARIPIHSGSRAKCASCTRLSRFRYRAWAEPFHPIAAPSTETSPALGQIQVRRLIQINGLAIAASHPSTATLEDSMTPGEIAVLSLVLGAFVVFAATLGWYSR